jgi:hypothetical protein
MTQSSTSRSSELRPGEVLRDGRYEIQELRRAARDKSVYLAQDRVLGCQVAVDAFSNDSPIVPGGLTVSAWETLVLGQLGDHPNIASVLERWEDGKTAFMSSRYLSGGSLRERIANSAQLSSQLRASPQQNLVGETPLCSAPCSAPSAMRQWSPDDRKMITKKAALMKITAAGRGLCRGRKDSGRLRYPTPANAGDSTEPRTRRRIPRRPRIPRCGPGRRPTVAGTPRRSGLPGRPRWGRRPIRSRR